MTASLLLLAFLLGSDSSGPVCSPPAAGAVGVGAPAGDDALRDAVAPLFGVIDTPVTAEAWRRLPPEALALLERIASDEGGSIRHRARALEGAAALGSDGALHRRLAADVATPYPVRASAIQGLGLLVPPARLRTELAGLLERDADYRVRSFAAATLARSAPAQSCAAVRAQASREGNAERGSFARALTACGAR